MSSNPIVRQQERQRQAESIILRGSDKIPDPPREVTAQPGSRKAVVSWSLPQITTGIKGWRIFKDTESNLYKEISDIGTTQCEVTLNSGATPPVTNIFICSLSTQGRQSSLVQVQCAATAEAGAPTDPPPTGGGGTGTGGGGTGGGGGRCFTGNTELRTELGNRKFEDIEVGDLVYSDGILRKVKHKLVHDFDGELLSITGTDWGVTEDHLMKVEGWLPASFLFSEKFHYRGKVYNLEMDAEEFDSKCYDLANGLTAHNSKSYEG